MPFDPGLLTDLVAYYRGEELAGADLIDAHSVGPFPLDETNAPGATAAGKVARARTYLLASTQYHRKQTTHPLFRTNESPVGAQQSWALNMWVKPDVLSGDHPIMTTSGVSGLFGHLMRVEATDGGRVAQYASADGTTFASAHASGTASVVAGQWHMITAGWDKAATELWLYLDSVPISSVTHTAYHTSSGENLMFAGWIAAGSWYSGALDEIAWWRNRAKLSQADVDQLWNSGNGISIGDLPSFDDAGVSLITVVETPHQTIAPATPNQIIV